LTDTDNEYLLRWFAPKALKELLTYRYFIEKGGYEYQDLLKVILCRSARSARLTTHFDLDFPKKPQTEPYYCYKHRRQCSPTVDAYKFILRYSLDTIRRINEFDGLRTEAKIDVYNEDSRYVDIPPIDGVITSPPYVGLIDRRHLEIGAAANGSSKSAQKKYQEDIAMVFRNIAKSMRSHGRMVVVANDSRGLYQEIANLAGLDCESIINRHVNRRTGRRSTEFYESIFVWKKRK
jgi:hypothetical protein